MLSESSSYSTVLVESIDEQLSNRIDGLRRVLLVRVSPLIRIHLISPLHLMGSPQYFCVSIRMLKLSLLVTDKPSPGRKEVKEDKERF